MDDDHELLTAAEVAKRFRVSAQAVYQWARDGILPGIQLEKGRAVRFRRSDVEKLLEPSVPGEASA